MPAITPRGIELNLDAVRPMDAIGVARTLLRTTRVTSLATLDPGGYPYSTVTNLIVEPDGTCPSYSRPRLRSTPATWKLIRASRSRWQTREAT